MFKRLTKNDDENYNSDDYDSDNYSFKEHHELIKCFVCDSHYYSYNPIDTEHQILSLKNSNVACCNNCCLNKKHLKDDVFYDCVDKKSNLYLFQKEFLMDRLGFYSNIDPKKKKKKILM